MSVSLSFCSILGIGKLHWNMRHQPGWHLDFQPREGVAHVGTTAGSCTNLEGCHLLDGNLKCHVRPFSLQVVSKRMYMHAGSGGWRIAGLVRHLWRIGVPAHSDSGQIATSTLSL